MKKFISTQKGITTMILLVLLTETLLNASNKIIQGLGICIVPVIGVMVVSLMLNDNKLIK